MCGSSTHDTRGSQVSHTCKISVTDLLNSTQIANSSDWYKNRVYSTHMYSELAVDLIREHARSGETPQPLFLYMAWQNCHAPYQAPTKYQALYPDLPAGKSQRCFNAMVSAMDEGIGAIVDAVNASGMYPNTVFFYSRCVHDHLSIHEKSTFVVRMCMLGATRAGPRYFSVTNLHVLVIGHVCSDNGGPARMANNMPLRGAKFGVFEGSFRVPAFVHSALLPAAVVGTVSHELFHITDLYATIAGLAGVDLGLVHNGSGPVPPDGMDVWSAIAGGDTSPRATIVHEYDPIKGDVYAFRSGEWKLIWGKIGDADWIADVSYDTGCTPLLPPSNTSLLGRAPVGPVFASEDHLPASTSAGPSDLTCTADKPCLFDVINDPTERHEVAAQQPSVVKRLQAELGEHLKNRYTGQLDRAKTSEADYCDFIERVKWVQPYDDIAPRPSPSPTPIPPAVAAELTGTWAQGWQLPGRLPEMMAVSVSSATGALAVHPVNCTGCCWSSAVGSFATGNKLRLLAKGSCRKEVEGTLENKTGVGPAGLIIEWGSGEWKAWVKI